MIILIIKNTNLLEGLWQVSIKKLKNIIMKTYKINIYSFFLHITVEHAVIFPAGRIKPQTPPKKALQIYLQANNNKGSDNIKVPIAILQGKFISDTSDLFFAVATGK